MLERSASRCSAPTPASIARPKTARSSRRRWTGSASTCPRAASRTRRRGAGDRRRRSGFPAILRPSLHARRAPAAASRYDATEFAQRSRWALAQSPTHEVLIEESVLGWKEFELEVMRDREDNFIVVCSIENIDPMGVHTGDSITVAPAMTLTDREYQRLRDAARAVMTGDRRRDRRRERPVRRRPEGRASRHRDEPARVALVGARVQGHRLPDREDRREARRRVHARRAQQRHHRRRPRRFEPVIDYVVVKLPRFAFEKFPGADTTLGTQMKCVGEVMSIGRTFCEALQKAARSLETGRTGSVGWTSPRATTAGRRQRARPSRARSARTAPSSCSRRSRLGDRVPARAAAARRPAIDPWFLAQIATARRREASVSVRRGAPASGGRGCAGAATRSASASPTARSPARLG